MPEHKLSLVGWYSETFRACSSPGALAARRLSQGAMPDLNDLAYGPMGAIRAIVFGSFVSVAGAAVFWWIAGRYIDVERRAVAES